MHDTTFTYQNLIVEDRRYTLKQYGTYNVENIEVDGVKIANIFINIDSFSKYRQKTERC